MQKGAVYNVYLHSSFSIMMFSGLIPLFNGCRNSTGLQKDADALACLFVRLTGKGDMTAGLSKKTIDSLEFLIRIKNMPD